MIHTIVKHFESIVVQRASVSTDVWGNPVSIWADYKTIQGRIRQLNSKELYQQKDNAVASHRLYTKDFTILVTDKIKFDGKIFEVKGINNVMNFDELNQVELWQVL